jgi:hypothetical protein
MDPFHVRQVARLYRFLRKKLKFRHVFILKCLDLSLQLFVAGLIALQYLLPPMRRTHADLVTTLITIQYISIAIHLLGIRRPWTIHVRRYYLIAMLVLTAPFRALGLVLVLLLFNPVVTEIVAVLLAGGVALALLYPILCFAELVKIIRKLKAVNRD